MDRIIHFQRRLAETITWCASKDWAANPAERLRTSELWPAFADNYGEVGEWGNDPEKRYEIVEQLALKRADLLRQQNISPPRVIPPLVGGRILVFAPDQSLYDGAANLATYGFCDGNNVPAWDTWIAYVTNDPTNTPQWPWYKPDSYLLSWVPEPLVEIVTDGIEVNPEECIFWAADLTSAFMRQLRQAGLLR